MKTLNSLQTYHFDAAIVLEDSCKGITLPHQASRVSLHTPSDVYSAVTWMPMSELVLLNGNVLVGNVHICNYLTTTEQSQFVLTRIDSPVEASALAHVNQSACPIEGEVDAVRALVSRIHSDHLREFVEQALTNIEAFRWFWTCPASMAHHHSGPGGLAQHSRHVAEQASLAVCDQSLQSDYAIAYGLLHDYGKIWSYEDGHLNEIANRLGHEQIGYEKLLPLLLRLRDASPEIGVVMQSLLSGQWKRDGKRPIQAVGNIVRSLDQYSAETNMSIRQYKNTQWQSNSV